MAVKPKQDEAFLREVDEELRKEQLNRFFARYGWFVIAGVVLLLAAIGGWIWWQGHREAQAAAQGEKLIEALESFEAGNREAAMARIDELAGSGVAGYRAAALFSRANAEVEANNIPAAVATLAAIAGDQGLAEPYRHAALVRQTQLEFDSLDPRQVIERLGPLARGGEPWFGSAGEMVAIAHLRLDQPDRAGAIFSAMARDETLPQSIRSRAVQMAGALGVDATEQTAPPADGNAAGE